MVLHLRQQGAETFAGLLSKIRKGNGFDGTHQCPSPGSPCGLLWPAGQGFEKLTLKLFSAGLELPLPGQWGNQASPAAFGAPLCDPWSLHAL